MKSNIVFLIELAVSFLPFILFAFFNGKANTKKEVRHRQYPMPILAVVYSAFLLIFLNKISNFVTSLFLKLCDLFESIKLGFIGEFIRDIYTSWGIYLSLVLFNTAALVLYVIIKRIITLILGKIKVKRNSFIGTVVELFYSYDEMNDRWYIKEHYGQARTFVKTAYYGSCFVSGLTLLVSCWLCMENLVSAPFYPVFAVIVIGEMAFFIDGTREDEEKSELSVQADNSKLVAMYPLLRKPLKALFGDKLSAEGTTVNNGAATGGAVEDILADLCANGGHIGGNYAAFIRQKMHGGLKPNIDYVRSGYDLAVGKSLLFNTPFYDKLNPYVFYAVNRNLLTGGKVLIVLGRHGTEDDLKQWTEVGMEEVSNIPGLWNISVLGNKKLNDDEIPDIGIISRSGVHDLDIHKNNLAFLKKVSFVIVVEPSRLVTTAQIGLNLLIKCCESERPITFCSVDRNCDGLVDALSHILMTNITEVSATEYPHGMSSYMYWTADDDYLQHRILPGISRCLGMGTEVSFVALKNQVKKTVWYGGEVFPVQDVRWIAKQYYYDLLDYAGLPTTQETFDRYFQTSFNMCNERVSDHSFVTVEDDRNNLFETRRNFATIAEQQGFINVISSEYMLREYMSYNTRLFTADAKAIPYITADYARTKRNAILSLCLLMCIDSVKEDVLHRQMITLNIQTETPLTEIWKELCIIFGSDSTTDKNGNPILLAMKPNGEKVLFEQDKTIQFKRAYSVESGKFESVYTIEDVDFSSIILDDLQHASYIAEQDSKDIYIGTELKGHVYQKYMPGQFFTLRGKYYEMISTATENRILVRRASEHIGGRLSYRQVREYTINRLEDSATMGALKTVNNIGINYQFADFSVETPGYWKMHAYNDFDNGELVKVNGVPKREYHHKQILKLDFSSFGDSFTDSVRMTLTNLLNETFITLFADNHPFISAITVGNYGAPLTYSLASTEATQGLDKCIFIMEDSQLDIGLLVAVERNIKRILHIISDYLSWNDEQIEESIRNQKEPSGYEYVARVDAYEEDEVPEKKKGLFGKLADGVKGLFRHKKKKAKNGKEKGEFAEESGSSENVDGTVQDVEVPDAVQETDITGVTPVSSEPESEAINDPSEESPENSIDAESAEELTPRQKKKAAKAAAKAERRALKEQRKAEKKKQKELKKLKKSTEESVEEPSSAEDEPIGAEQDSTESGVSDNE